MHPHSSGTIAVCLFVVLLPFRAASLWDWYHLDMYRFNKAPQVILLHKSLAFYHIPPQQIVCSNVGAVTATGVCSGSSKLPWECQTPDWLHCPGSARHPTGSTALGVPNTRLAPLPWECQTPDWLHCPGSARHPTGSTALGVPDTRLAPLVKRSSGWDRVVSQRR